MKTPIYTTTGEKSGTVELPSNIFEIELNADLIHQVAVAQAANKRQVSAHTKTRGEVAGGGAKPWRQKGTGRARVGSNRSPIWKGGGVTFGPRNDKSYKQKINKKMRRKALFSVLSEKARQEHLFVVDTFGSEDGKASSLKDLMSKLPMEKKNTLLALPTMDKKTIQAASNLENAQAIQARDLNVLDLLNTTYLVLEKDAVKTIEETFAK